MQTPEQKAAYITAKTASMLVEMNGMIAENQYRIHRDETVAYGLDHFMELVTRYGLDENSLRERCW